MCCKEDVAKITCLLNFYFEKNLKRREIEKYGEENNTHCDVPRPELTVTHIYLHHGDFSKR